MMDPTEAVEAEAHSAPPAPAPLAPLGPDAPPEVLDVPERRGLRAWLGNVWSRLMSPTTRTPADYTGRRLPRIINDLVDARHPDGAAHQAMLGEAVGLVIDHAMTTRGMEAKSPLGHLAGASGEYVWLSWDHAAAAMPALPPGAAAVPDASTPAPDTSTPVPDVG